MATSRKAVADGSRVGKQDAREAVSAWIAEAQPFAQPILRYLRSAVHEAAPDAVEEIKWSRPFFTVGGTMVCYLSAFTKHCGFGFWSPLMTGILSSDGVAGAGASGSLGRITAVEDLPAREDLLRWIGEAARRARTGTWASGKGSGKRTSAKAEIAMPDELTAALEKSKAAADTFQQFSPSCRREYLEWITSAKRQETRERRVTETVGRLRDGKRFNEQYRTPKV